MHDISRIRVNKVKHFLVVRCFLISVNPGAGDYFQLLVILPSVENVLKFRTLLGSYVRKLSECYVLPVTCMSRVVPIRFLELQTLIRAVLCCICRQSNLNISVDQHTGYTYRTAEIKATQVKFLISRTVNPSHRICRDVRSSKPTFVLIS
jgi:hypothetical protein